VRGKRYLTRYGAPAVFLAAATAAVLLIRAGLGNDESAAPSKAGRAPQVLVSNPSERSATAPGKRFYVIRAGDTLDAVARRFQTSVGHLLALNPGVEPTSLRIGQRIRTA
jgi:LysM repeat protein